LGKGLLVYFMYINGSILDFFCNTFDGVNDFFSASISHRNVKLVNFVVFVVVYAKKVIFLLEKLATELKIRGFSPKTIKAYVKKNQRFLEFIGEDANDVNEDDVKSYIAYLMDKGQKPASVSLAMSAIRFLQDEMLGKGLFVKIKQPKLEKKLPTVLSKEEIRRMLDATENTKHKLLIAFLYSSGLRVSEAVSMKIDDIDLNERMGIVRAGKGKARGRKYKKKKGPLIVVSKINSLSRAFTNIPGIDIVEVKSLNAEIFLS